MPGEDPAIVLAQLRGAAGKRVAVRARRDAQPSKASDASSPVFATIRRVSESFWPGTPVVPTMSAGATDGSLLREAGIPTYGVSGFFIEYGELREHGRDERVPVKSFFEGVEFLHRLVKALGSAE